MVVEFCGIPGGGKSTLYRAYLERYSDDAVGVQLDMHSRLSEIALLCAYVLRHPLSFLWVCIFAVRFHMRGLFFFSLHLALRAAAKQQKTFLYRSAGKILLDEGLVHVLCTLPGRPLGHAEMQWWLHRTPLPQVVCIAREGNFHRFHGERTVVHPRAAQGEEALRIWKEAVRANTATVEACLGDMRASVWNMPQQNSSVQVLESLHTFLTRA